MRETTILHLIRKPWIFLFLFTSKNTPRLPLPLYRPTPDELRENAENFALRWFGHSTLILELSETRILTDPIFGNASPFPGLMKRFQSSPIRREELPPIDCILISHNHYDHLEASTIRALRKDNTPLIVPKGLGATLEFWGISRERIHELAWDESISIGAITITATPARHYSGRGLRDRHQSHWNSYILDDGLHKVFFGGDSSYGTHFRDIGELHGGFDLVLLEIDAWNELWPDHHMFPHEALRATQELNSRLFMPIHWGVFDLAMHPWDESIRTIINLFDQAQIPTLTPVMGEKVRPGITETPRWWEA